MPAVTDPTLLAELEKTQSQIDRGGGSSAVDADGQIVSGAGVTANKRVELKGDMVALDQFEQDLVNLEGLYENHFKNQGILTPLEWASGVFNPNADAYNKASMRMLPLVAKALGFTAKQMDTPAEIERLKAYVPINSDPDKTAQEKLTALRGMLMRQRANLQEVMGGKSPQKQLAGEGATTTLEDAPPELQQEVANYLKAIKPGTLTPEAYAGFVEAQRLKYGWAKDSLPYTPEFVKPFVDEFNKAGKAGAVQPFQRQMSTGEQMLNNAGSSVLGAGVIGAADAITGGFMPEIAGLAGGDEAAIDAGIQQVRDASPVASFVGNMVGGAMLPIGRGVGAARLAGEAAAYGAYSGAGNAEGGFTDRLDEAAIGAGAGGVLGYLGGRLADRISARMNGGPPPPSGSAQRMADAKDFGIDLSIGDAGGRGAKIVERTLDALPASASVMEAARGRLRNQVEVAVETLAGKAGNASGNAGMGASLQRGVKAAMERADDESTALYQAISIPDSFPANMANTVQALEKLTTKFASNPDFAARRVNHGMLRDLEALKSGGLTWAEMKAYRSDIGEQMGEAIIGAASSRKELGSLYAALSDDMRATAMDRGPAALSAFERANKHFNGKQNRLEKVYKQFIGKDFDANPEAAANRLRAIISDGKATASIADLAQIRGGMKGDEWGQVQSGLIRLMGHPAKSEGRDFDPSIFIRAYKDMTPKARNVMFGGQKKPLRQELDKFAEVMEGLAASNATRNTSQTGNVSGGLATASLFLVDPTSLVGGLATQYGGAKLLWTNPTFVNWATGYTRMLKGATKAGHPPAMSKQMGYLGRVAKSQPAIAQDILGLRTALENAFAQSAASTPARLAAAEKENNKEGQK